MKNHLDTLDSFMMHKDMHKDNEKDKYKPGYAIKEVSFKLYSSIQLQVRQKNLIY